MIPNWRRRCAFRKGANDWRHIQVLVVKGNASLFNPCTAVVVHHGGTFLGISEWPRLLSPDRIEKSIS